jgi:hypothetical protein
MKATKFAAPLALCLLVLNLAHSKPKKADVPAVFENAKYVYVEAIDGDSLRPGLFPEDRQAIFDVQDSLRQWKRYALTVNRADADLVFVVRKGRLAAAQLQGGISGGFRPQPGSPQASPTRGTEVGVRAEVGPPDDLLRVYIQNEGELSAIVWDRSQEGGLDAPGVQLVKQLKAAVERAYPQTPPPPKKP